MALLDAPPTSRPRSRPGRAARPAFFVRLLFQPALVLGALWATGAWRDRRRG